MNKVQLSGRLTADPEIHGNGDSKIAKYTLAVDRRFKKEGGDSADFIRCTTFGKGAELAEKYFTKGTKLIVVGRIQTGSYTNRDGQKVFTTDVIVEESEFAESKKTAQQSAPSVQALPPHQMPPQQMMPQGYPPQYQQYPQQAYYPPVQQMPPQQQPTPDFMKIPEGAGEELPFKV